MEIYDTANKLAVEIKNSNQYKALKEFKDKIMSDEVKKQKIIDFEKLKQEIQIMEIQKSEDTDKEEKRRKLVNMYNELIGDEDIKAYFEYEIAFNQLMVDINKIIGNSIKEVL